MVLKADKGNTTVTFDVDDYHNKMMAILKDRSLKKLKKDPSGRTERTATRLLESNEQARGN